MAFRQYTQCVDIENFDPGNPLTGAVLLGLYVTLPVGVLPALMVIAGIGGPLCLLLLAEVYVIASFIGYSYWFLYRRLICIPAPPEYPADSGGDHLAIGTLINILPPEPVGDNDYSISILPQSIPLGTNGPFHEANPAPGPYGYLITEQPVTLNDALLYTGHRDTDTDPRNCPANTNDQPSEDLHCEFEGRGMYDIFLASRIALFPAVAAVFACLIPGVAGWIVALLAILAALILAGGIALGPIDGGDPNDVNPNTGELHTNQCDHTGADCLVIKGRWVYDSGHRFPLPFSGGQPGAWNELHPITFCCKTTCDAGDVILLRQRWNEAIGDARSPATLESQKAPQNQWQVHPLIDGCQAVIIL